MNNSPLPYIQTLNTIFEDALSEAYRITDSKKRMGILPYLQAIYRRWYYSAIIEDSFLTPANITESICRHYSQPASTYPVVHRRGKSKFTGLDITLMEYSLDNHPIIADMALLFEYCTPYIDLSENEAFSPAQAIEIGAKLSLNDPHYGAYLLEVALRMKFIKKMPSVGVHRYRLTDNAVKKLEMSFPRELLYEIVDTTISIAAKALQSLVMLPEILFTPSFIRSLLTVPMETDDIFSRIYDVLGYDLEDLVDIVGSAHDDDDEPDDLDMDLLIGTFMAGVLLDKFFFTPFGHFLKLIRPLYVLPFEIEGEIAEYITISHDPEESIIAFFAPCSSYTLTDMGLELFEVQKTEENYVDVTKVVPFDSMKDSVFSSKEALGLFAAVAKHLGPMHSREAPPPKEVYTFRARLQSDTAIWAHIQMPPDTTLDDLYIEIADCLDLKDNGDYSFFHDKTENRFAEYPAPKRVRRGCKNTANIALENLDFERQKHMLLAAYNQAVPFGGENPTERVQLEMMHKKPAQDYYEYPRVSRLSPGLCDRMEW